MAILRSAQNALARASQFAAPEEESTIVTPKQKRFVAEYLANGLNATKASLAAGYSKRSAEVEGSRLLRNAKVAAAVAHKAEKHLAKLDYSADRTLQEIARLAFSDVRQLFEDDGSLKQLKDLSDDAAACIAGLEVTELFEGADEQKHAYGLLKKIKIADKGSALDKLMRYHALYKDTVKHTGPDGGPIQAEIIVKFVDSSSHGG